MDQVLELFYLCKVVIFIVKDVKTKWNINKGKKIEIDDLVNELNKKVFNKKITISGGEPLMQKEALIELVTKLNDLKFDIALYTGHQREDVPSILVEKIKYLKSGNFVQKLKTTIKPFVGSENQIFEVTYIT